GTANGALPIGDFADPDHAAAFSDLVAAADPACTTRTISAAWSPPPAGGPWPLVAFSHCHECTRFSGMTIAARLASHGFAVVTVDHTGNTLWDQLDMDGLPLDGTTLDLRVGDVAFAVARARGELASMTGVAIDPGPIGVFGHSFGSVTAGLYAQRNGAEVGAAFGLAAPMENPLLPGVTITEIDAPLGFLVAREDNSISELGNELIRGNFMRAPGPAWKLEVADAGHWSVSDLVGVVPAFAPGCGDGTRQTDGQPFTYLPAETGRAIAAAYVTAFFKATLLGDAGAEAYLSAERPEGTVTAEAR
ncbi:MAG: alpha/beta hydrolase, partial [Kofleriaceae bacterium]